MTSHTLNAHSSAESLIEALSDEDMPTGFRFGWTTCGIKQSGLPDLSVIVADRPIVAAGVYTTNQIVAAPVTLCRSRTPSDRFRAVVTNSGNANACTGEPGMRNAQEMTRQVADQVGCDADDVLVMSTGVIGRPLPMEKIASGIPDAIGQMNATAKAFLGVAQAIRTTDQYTKIATRGVTLSTGPVRVAAMAKGAGMIEPNMATLLAVVLTDASLSKQQADAVLRNANEASLNCISVDGHMSTNDTCLLLASGDGAALNDDDQRLLTHATTDLLIELGKLIVADGEGATHFMDLNVQGAANDEDAKTIARAVGNSPLVKTALTGADPNWGRIVSAAGYAGPTLQADKTCLRLLDVEIYRNGTPLDYDAKSLSERMNASEQIDIELIVGDGPGTARFWASDLTKDYVAFNSEYTT